MKDNSLKITSTAFCEGDMIPVRYTGRGEDVSPALFLENVCSNAESIAITMDDMTHPLFGVFNHWVIWNIPVTDSIPEGISHGSIVTALGNAIQGIGYGKHRYKGPKPPFRTLHTYAYTVYVLDCICNLPVHTRKSEFLTDIEGHILQQAVLTGKFQSYPRQIQ